MTTVTLSPQLSARGALYHADLAASDLRQRIKFRGITYQIRSLYRNIVPAMPSLGCAYAVEIRFDSTPKRSTQTQTLIVRLPPTTP
ncbi:MAG: hypothetical protein RM021_022370 [Nostoc sp. EkiNYC01]|nr:hypothetical protein [Nostoc sp. EkiNYC01]